MEAPRNERPIEPWPFAVGAALISMICVCITFWWIAAANPDAELLGAGERPGLVAKGDERGGG